MNMPKTSRFVWYKRQRRVVLEHALELTPDVPAEVQSIRVSRQYEDCQGMAVVTVSKGANSGFSLIEILVVLAVLSVCLGLIAMSPNSYRVIYSQAESLQHVMKSAAEDAVFSNVEVGLALTQRGYCIVKYDPKYMKWTQQERCRDVPQGMKLSLVANGRVLALSDVYSSQNPLPFVVFYASGESTVFILAVTGANSEKSVAIMADGMGGIELQSGQVAP